ncbi:imidazole glycerol phosphate synthase subunit HisH [Thalassotalea euphylliae]|uniref:Imidazole glycerol phosphate synthase subunit HisH n=1 Tax=Thalassotalea euphylliae TaxID=1655234 RepID=A0A3E0U031_9GAMM|nr:imidazole glycerol phosphate synthase subunit HisH [Thalassotalea euphylliae]REL30276.1 imidazole glycerol phosphate synthase subunit HisH [Thalassotalea euphylliae]
MIGILDIGLGNIQSVYNAIYENGYDPVLVNQPEQLRELSHFIMPGVGNFSAVSQMLAKSGFDRAIKNLIAEGKPTLGICLGMQLLASFSREVVGDEKQAEGLDIIPAQVLPIADTVSLPVPHVGWNEAKIAQKHPIFENIKNLRDFYFVHSYHMQCQRSEHVLATTDYQHSLVCIVAKDNVVGVQFHPEKSQKNGMQLLENFCEWDGVWQPEQASQNQTEQILKA